MDLTQFYYRPPFSNGKKQSSKNTARFPNVLRMHSRLCVWNRKNFYRIKPSLRILTWKVLDVPEMGNVGTCEISKETIQLNSSKRRQTLQRLWLLSTQICKWLNSFNIDCIKEIHCYALLMHHQFTASLYCWCTSWYSN